MFDELELIDQLGGLVMEALALHVSLDSEQIIGRDGPGAVSLLPAEESPGEQLVGNEERRQTPVAARRAPQGLLHSEPRALARGSPT